MGAFCIAGKSKSGIVQDSGGCFRINFILHRFNIALILHFTFVIYDSQCAKEHKRKQRNVKFILGVFAEQKEIKKNKRKQKNEKAEAKRRL